MSTRALLTRRTALLAKKEANPGTPEALTATDGKFLITQVTLTPQFENIERQIFRDTLSPVANTVSQRSAQLTFSVEVRRSNTGATPDAWASTLLPACAMKETIGGSSVTYTPSSNQDDWASLTMAMNIDGFEVTIAGARGTVEFSGTVGEIMLANFTFTGFLVSAIDTASPAVTHETGLPHPFQGIDLQYGTGTRFVVSSQSTPASGGTFILTIDGTATGAIAYNATAAQLTTAIEAVVGGGDVTVTALNGANLGTASAIMLVEITDRAHKTVSINGASLTGNAHRLTGTFFELTSQATAATAGSFTVTVNGTAITFAFDDNATEIQTAVDAHPDLAGSLAFFLTGAAINASNANVFVFCNPVTSGASTNYHITWNLGGLTGNKPTLEAHAAELVSGDDICVENITIALNNDVQLLTCANNDSGIVGYTITARAPSISLNPQLTKDSEPAVAPGLASYWTHVQNQTQVYIQFHAGNLGGVDSRVRFSIPEVYWSDIGQEERNGIAVSPLTGTCTSDSAGGDDEIVITMT